MEDRLQELQQQWEDGLMDESRYVSTVLQLRAEIARVASEGSEGAQRWLELIDEEVESFQHDEAIVDPRLPSTEPWCIRGKILTSLPLCSL